MWMVWWISGIPDRIPNENINEFKVANVEEKIKENYLTWLGILETCKAYRELEIERLKKGEKDQNWIGGHEWKHIWMI